MKKSAYNEVAQTINAALKGYDDGAFQPRVTVIDTSNHGKYYGKYSLAVNDTLYDLLQRKGLAQDLFYSDEVYTHTERDGTDYDMYIEPVTPTLFDLAIL